MARDVTIIVMLIVIAAAIPEMLAGAVDAVKRRCKRARRDNGTGEEEDP